MYSSYAHVCVEMKVQHVSVHVLSVCWDVGWYNQESIVHMS